MFDVGRAVLASCDLVRVSDRVLALAATLQPEEMRSLDAIHLATATMLGRDIDELVTYDRRLAQAAAIHDITVSAPG